ncbi:hypothetical protein [Bradyrhizobium sp. LA6.10]|uniref:hypothetical protein n=1 Tax=unclassified Bradyrhizobium TaxID=2631580 RepID=UPI00339B61F4
MDYAADIRKVLLELVNHCLKDKAETAAPILKQLARKGNALYKTLFLRMEGDEDAAGVKKYYASLGEPFRIEFRVADSVLVPWGLMYSGDPELLPDDWRGIEQTAWWHTYHQFWCFAHDTTVRYIGIKPSQVGDASSLGMLRVAHPSVFGKAKDTISSEVEKSFSAWLDERYGMPINTEQALKDSWQERASQIGLLYFYCHATPNQLAIGTDDTINASGLFLILADTKRDNETGCLVFINGCRTAAADPGGTFLLPASVTGHVGFVGTETDVPDVFALRFSTSLLHLLFKDGKTLGEAMSRLYRDHFPLSLVYGIYAHPNFRMCQDGAPSLSKQTNFSDDVVGSGRLEIPHGQ